MATPSPCVPCCSTPQVVNVPGIDGADGATGPAGPNNITAATTTNLTGVLIGNGALVSAAAILPVVDGGTGYGLSPARESFSVATKFDNSTSTPTMMGYSALAPPSKITPVTSGTILVIVTGLLVNDTSSDGATVQVRYGPIATPGGTISSPGTALGQPKLMYAFGPTVASMPFSVSQIITGLTLSAACYIDLELYNITGGKASVFNVDIVLIEL